MSEVLTDPRAVRPSRPPRIGVEDVGTYFVRDDGSLWRCVSYAAEPTATLECVVDDCADIAGARRSGVVGAMIFEGFRRLRPEDDRS